jgi:pimeloyl-ACP methyl ester carboxylesterase
VPTPVSLVLVPGLGLDERSWRRVPTFGAADVVLLPGMGRPDPVPSFDDLVAELRAALPEGPVVLVGHSQSCQVVAAAAADPRVAGVVLCGPTTDPRMRPLRVLAARWLRTALGEPWEQVPLILRQWWHTGPRAMAALWRTAAPDRIERHLTGLAVPVVVLRGTRDALCPADWARQVAAAAPRGQLVELPRAAHMLPQTHPEDVVAAVLGHWPSVRPRTSE